MKIRISSSLLLVIITSFILIGETNGDSIKKSDQAKILFSEVQLSIFEKNYDQAYSLAEKLIRENAGDYQIRIYLDKYSWAFYYLDKDFQRGQYRPEPEGIKKRIKAMENKAFKQIWTL